MTAKILLTGGLGYIGSHTYVELVAAGYDVVVLDNLRNAKQSVSQRLEKITGIPTNFIQADVLDKVVLASIFSDHSFDAVIHFAGLKAVGESVEKPLEYIQVNFTGLANVLQAMQVANVKSIVFSSSATVYDAAQTSPLTEDMPKGYVNPYGFTKLSCEQMLEQASVADPTLKTGVLRYFNPAGAHASGLIGDDPNNIPNNLMPYISRVASGRYPFVRIWGNDYDTPDGTGVRDYIHVSDLAVGHVKSLQTLLAGDGSHVVNLGTGRGYSVMDMINAYSAACGFDLPYEIMPRRAGDIATMYADVGRAKQLLGFCATRDMDDMCISSWNWIETGSEP